MSTIAELGQDIAAYQEMMRRLYLGNAAARNKIKLAEKDIASNQAEIKALRFKLDYANKMVESLKREQENADTWKS